MITLITHATTRLIIRGFVAVFGFKWLFNALFTQFPAERIDEELDLWLKDVQV